MTLNGQEMVQSILPAVMYHLRFSVAVARWRKL